LTDCHPEKYLPNAVAKGIAPCPLCHLPTATWGLASIKVRSRLSELVLMNADGSQRIAPQPGVRNYLSMTRNTATNVWEQPLSGEKPHPITDFTSGRIFNFAWTKDGKQLLFAKAT